MTALAASDVAYSSVTRQKVNGSPSRYMVKATAIFGNAALTYPAGGVPLTKASIGLPVVVEQLSILDDGNADGYVYKWDATNNKIRIYQAAAQTHSHDILLKNAAVADGAGTRVNAGANLLGANTGGDLTVTGGGANGGVVSKTLAAGALVELGAVAIPSNLTLILSARGY